MTFIGSGKLGFAGEQFEILDGRFGAASVRELFGYEVGWGLPGEADRAAIAALMSGPSAERGRVAPSSPGS